jgi:tetratricopeptide (TPR) repeat protein
LEQKAYPRYPDRVSVADRPARRARVAAAVEPFTRTGSFVLRQTVATPPRVYGLVLLALVALFSLTAVVAARYHAERDALAREHYAQGRALARAGRPNEAIRWLRASLALDRTHPDVQLALATTLFEAGRPREAGAYLAGVLRAMPTSGAANLVRARVSRALGNHDEADLYYQRAIHGEWPPAAAARRRDARFELIDFLLERQDRARAAIELTALEAVAGDDPDAGRRVGRLFLKAGAPDQAARVLQRVTSQRPEDGEAWVWLSEAEFAVARYAAAIAAADRAIAVRPDEAASERITVASAILSLDPTTRRLRAAERERRARVLLERGLAVLDACLDPAEGAAGAPVEGARADTRALLARRPRRTADAADEALDRAEILWRFAVSTCPAAREHDAVLARVMDLVLAEGAPS